MIRTLAISGYRSIRDLTVELDQFNIVTGPNGSGKSSLYRALRLLAQSAQGGLTSSIAAEGGLSSILWAGPEKYSRGMLSGDAPIQGTVRSAPTALKLGYLGDQYGYAIDLGMPEGGAFPLDPEIKVETMWMGDKPTPSNIFAERRGPSVRLRSNEDGCWRQVKTDLSSFDSMVSHGSDVEDGLELLLMRETMRGWRFYDALRTDMDAPARKPHLQTFTPILASDGSDLGAAIATIQAIGDGQSFDETINDAFPGGRLEVRGSQFAELEMFQKGLLRPLSVAELSDGTLRYLLLAAALLTPRPPEIMVLNEPESSLHPSLLDALARLLHRAARDCQIILVSHSSALIDAVAANGSARRLALRKQLGETKLEDDETVRWAWPKR